jgi:hypothetical protein
MKKRDLKLLLNPFEKIAGWEALFWGVGGLIVSVVLAYFSGNHYQGLLHFGPGINDTLWCFAGERAVVWLVPAIMFYIGGRILSKSKIRMVDVFGTMAFSLLPYIVMDLFYLLPPLQKFDKLDLNPAEIYQLIDNQEFQNTFLAASILLVIGLVFCVWALVWMYKALKISCNLKGAPLVILYAVGIIGGDIVSRIIIRLFY